MDQIRMVDLSGQHKKIAIDINTAINTVMDTTAFIRGPQVGVFEKTLAEYLGCNHVIGCANGTDALQLALMALNLPAGAEVITPDFTFVATAEVVRLLGFTPVLVDVDPHTFNIDIDKLESAISDKTKVVIPVHLFGQCADMKSIMDIANKHNLFVIEDTAQAIGTDYIWPDGRKQKAGTIGHFGTTSFFPSKNLGCAGDGGAIFCNDPKLARDAAVMANHGMDEQYLYEKIGINSRLDTIQASILSVKLNHIDEYNKARQAAADFYDNAFMDIEGLKTPSRASFSSHTFHQYTLQVTNGKRDLLMKFLNDKGVPNKVYYPVPIHKNAPYAQQSKYDETKLEVTRELCERVISLPMHTELSQEHLTYICESVKSFFK